MIYFRCSCGKELKVPDSLARKVVTCNNCGKKNIQLPGAGERLDLSDYELEDIDAGTIVLEPPSALSSIAPRKPIKNQPAKKVSGKSQSKPVAEARPNKVPRKEVEVNEPAPVSNPKPNRELKRNSERREPAPKAESRPSRVAPRRGSERREPEPEPQEEFEDEPARPTRNTRRLEEKKEVAPAPRSERASRRDKSRDLVKKIINKVELEDDSPLKTKSSQIIIETLSKLVEDLKEDEQETQGEMKAARKGRGDRGSGRGSGSKAKRSRNSEPDEDLRDYGNSQKFLYVFIGVVILIGIGVFFWFKESGPKKPPIVATETVDPTKPLDKVAPKVDPPKYERIIEEGNKLLTLFDVTGPNKEAIKKALEEKRVSAVSRKMGSKSYDSYIQVVLKQKLANVLAINHALTNINFENEEHKHILYTLFDRINAVSYIYEDVQLMKGFPVDMNAAKITWEKDKLIEFLENKKKDFNNDLTKIEIITKPIEWKDVVDIVVNGKVEDDTTDIQIPQ